MTLVLFKQFEALFSFVKRNPKKKFFFLKGVIKFVIGYFSPKGVVKSVIKTFFLKGVIKFVIGCFYLKGVDKFVKKRRGPKIGTIGEVSNMGTMKSVQKIG